MIRNLSTELSSGVSRSRFCLRETDCLEIVDTLTVWLEKYTGAIAEIDPFTIENSSYSSGAITVSGYNIIVNIDTSPYSSDVFLLTAHYDAIGSRSDGWREEWDEAPAPGANDNASGVAAVIEAAGILSKLELPFDLRVILFSGEELDKLGSYDYVEEKCDDDCATRILGVINLDMLGYSGDGRGVTVMSDEYSGWMASLALEAAEEIVPELPARLIKPGPWNWDHASFWAATGVQISAITLSEPLGETGTIIYPHYHTVRDTLGHVDIGQVVGITNIVTGFLADLADSPPELAMFDTDIVYYVDGIEKAFKRFQEGESIDAVIKVRNKGGADSPGEEVFLTINHESTEGTKTLYSDYVDIPGVLRTTEVSLFLDESIVKPGGNILRARISSTPVGDDPENDSAVSVFTIEGEHGGLLNHYFMPNPVDREFSEAMFCIDLASEADLKIKIYTLEGTLVSAGVIGDSYGVALDPGYSCHSCGELFPDIGNLASGIYVYRVLVFPRNGIRSDYRGRFAIVN
ncbi:MAG: M28 family peptidase [Bacteroidales bacterium]|nr:M28 family peptidase [Candidatus Latescibacterota bacterium]